VFVVGDLSPQSSETRATAIAERNPISSRNLISKKQHPRGPYFNLKVAKSFYGPQIGLESWCRKKSDFFKKSDL